MKKILIAITALSLSFASCSDNQDYYSQSPVTVNVQSNNISGFDVSAFSNLLKSTTDPDALTQQLNQPNNPINNLDLDNDGNIDYLKVDQTSNNSLTVYDETSSDRVVVATLTVNTSNNSYSIVGNQTYCGSNYTYNSPSGLTFGDYVFLSWMLRPHSYYHPYWGYHRGYYSGYSYYHSYRPYTRTYTRTTIRRPSYNSNRKTNYNSYSSSTPPTTRTSISTPTRSQRSFSSGEGTRFRNSGYRTNTFGSSRTNSTRSSFSSSRSSFGSSRSSFGSSRSSFGSSRSSFGSSRRR